MKAATAALTGVALALALAAPPAAASPDYAPSAGAVVQRRLDNGLTVAIQEDHRAPMVSLELRFEAGEGGASPEHAGAATLATYMMTRVTRHLKAGDYDHLLARAGATGVQATAWSGGVRFGATLPAADLALPLWLWSDAMGFFDEGLDDVQLTLQRNHLRQQRSTALSAGPTARLDALAAEELFPPGHPARVGHLVSPESVERLDRAVVLSFHDRWLTPPHATLAIVGDVVATDAMAVVERYFSAIPGGPAQHLAPPPYAPLAGETQIDVAAALPMARVSIRWPTPRLLTVEDARLDVIARLLRGVRSAWLFSRLVDDKKVAVGVTVRQRSGELGSQFDITVDGAPGRTAAEVLAALDSALDEARARPPSPAAIDGAVYDTLIGRSLALDTPASRVEDLAKGVTLAGTANYASYDFGRYQDLTPAQLQMAMMQFLPRDRRVVLLVTPTPGAPPGGEPRARRFSAARAP